MESVEDESAAQAQPFVRSSVSFAVRVGLAVRGRYL